MSDNAGDMKYALRLEELSRATGMESRQLLDAIEALGGEAGQRGKVRPSAVREILTGLGASYAPKVVVHMNLRGGVGKTTSSLSLATRAVQYGYRTCLLDLDSQGSSTLGLGVTLEEDDPIFIDVWQNPEAMLMGSLRKLQEGLYLLPSALENGLLDSSLQNPASQKNAVRRTCDVLKKEGFHLVVIDCPPSLGAAIISAVCAADLVVIPVMGDPFSRRGLELTLREIGSICETFGLPVPATKILYSRFDRRERLTVESHEMLSDKYGDLMLPFTIRTSTQYSRHVEDSESVFASSAKSKAYDDYDLYARHVLGLTEVLSGGATEVSNDD